LSRFLILDVARYKYPPVWVKACDLFEAMLGQRQQDARLCLIAKTGAPTGTPVQCWPAQYPQGLLSRLTRRSASGRNRGGSSVGRQEIRRATKRQRQIESGHSKETTAFETIR